MIREEAGLKAVTQTFHFQTKRERRAQNGCEKRGPDNSETKRNSRGGEKARDGLVGKSVRESFSKQRVVNISAVTAKCRQLFPSAC